MRRYLGITLVALSILLCGCQKQKLDYAGIGDADPKVNYTLKFKSEIAESGGGYDAGSEVSSDSIREIDINRPIQ